MTGTPQETPARQTEVRPGRSWYIVAVLVAAATLAAVAALAVPLVRGFAEVFSLEYLQAPGRGEVHLSKAGEYSVYAEVGRTYGGGGVTLTTTKSPPALDVTVRRADSGEQLPLSPGDAEMKLQVNNRHFRPIHRFSLDRPGTVVVESARAAGTGGRSVTLAIGARKHGRDILRSVLRVFLILGTMLFGGGGALAVFLVTLLRRVRAKRRLAE
jgi:hypothetical protein